MAREDLNDDDAGLYDDGILIDPYGDECGECFFEKGAGAYSKLGTNSPLLPSQSAPTRRRFDVVAHSIQGPA